MMRGAVVVVVVVVGLLDAVVSFSGETSAYVRPARASAAVALTDPRLASGPVIDQVHLTGGPPDAVLVTFTAAAGVAVAGVSYRAKGTTQAWRFVADLASETTQSLDVVVAPKKKNNVTAAAAATTFDDLGDYRDPASYYGSPVIYHAALAGLEPSTEYEYAIAGREETFAFKTAAAVGAGSAVRFGVIGDLGQTEDSLVTLKHLMMSRDDDDPPVDLVLFAGDLAYADGEGARWDSYGRLTEFALSAVPVAHCPGNHEFGVEQFQPYLARYPHPAAVKAHALWYSFDVANAHVIMLCAYCDVRTGSPQIDWLLRDLEASVNRSVTPWLIASFHAPWYNSNEAHRGEANALLMQRTVEPLFARAGVDLVLTGHVHAYERSYPIKTTMTAEDGCGTVHIGIGDGGNREGLAAAWVHHQPDFSAFREASFGHATLDLANASHARWSWFRNDDGLKVRADDVHLIRCPTGGVRYA